MSINLNYFSSTQLAMAQRIAELSVEQQARELLKWALARIVFYGPLDDPCAQVIREYLNEGSVNPGEFKE